MHTGTVDEELKAFLAAKTAEMEDGWKAMEATGIKEVQATAAQQRKDWPALRTQLTPAWKTDIEEKRKNDKDEFAAMMKVWTERYPVDPNAAIARDLHDFINATGDVDYAAKQHMVVSEGGSGLMFVNEAYNAKPWQWRCAFELGPEGVNAARAAAQAWLKEMGK